MPAFFVPNARTPEQAEEVWQQLRDHLERSVGLPVTDRRIFRIDFRHDGGSYTAEVGRVDSRQRETVLAIFELEGSFRIFTPSRGVLKGGELPMMVGLPATDAVVDFE